MNYKEQSLKAHEQWRGKIEMRPRVPVESKEDLCLAYTPGVSAACLAIHEDVNKSFALTRRWNTVPVITDGTAVLGLGDIGPEAGLPVMEGKARCSRRSAISIRIRFASSRRIRKKSSERLNCCRVPGAASIWKTFLLRAVLKSKED